MIYVISIVKFLINIYLRERRKLIENQKINSVKNNIDENNCIYIYIEYIEYKVIVLYIGYYKVKIMFL